MPKEMRLVEREIDEIRARKDGSGVNAEESAGIGGDCLLGVSDLKPYNYMFEKSMGVCRYVYKVTLHRGLRFGELGIANKAPRSATILANVQVRLL